MPLAAGAISAVSVSDVKASLLSAAASGGTGPYTYQWYRSQTAGFTPGGGNIIAGATSLVLNDSGLTPGSVYYYKVVATDSLAATATSSQLEVDTLQQQVSQNAFGLGPFLGMLDQKFNGDTLEVAIDVSQVGSLIAGSAVKFVATAGGVPKVVGCTSAADVAAGFINYDIKSRAFVAGDKCEISMRGNVMFMFAAQAVSRGQEVTSLPAGVAGGCAGGVIPAVPAGGVPKVGFALDTMAIGQLGRIYLSTPAYVLS